MLFRIAGIRRSFLALLIVAMPIALARAETLDELYAKAKQEGALEIYGGGGKAGTQAAADAFMKRWPGITVTAHGDFSNVLDNEIDKQIASKHITADYLQLQTVEDYARWDKQGALMHWKPEGFDQVYDKMKGKNGAWVATNANPMLYGYNPDKVAEADVPKSALDFLKPQFKGKMVTAYPADDDATLYNFVLIERKYGTGWLKKYLANGGSFIQGHRDVTAQVRSGANYVLSFDTTNGSQTNGPGPNGNLKVAMSAKDKTPVFFTGSAILKAAPHPNAAKLYLQWQLSKELQGKNPALYYPRRDIPPPAGMPPLTSPRFANDYRDFVGDGTQVAKIRARYLKITGPVVNKATVP
jgi:ABC-type Fe3+ transport system substrate-binding protein